MYTNQKFLNDRCIDFSGFSCEKLMHAKFSITPHDKQRCDRNLPRSPLCCKWWECPVYWSLSSVHYMCRCIDACIMYEVITCYIFDVHWLRVSSVRFNIGKQIDRTFEHLRDQKHKLLSWNLCQRPNSELQFMAARIAGSREHVFGRKKNWNIKKNWPTKTQNNEKKKIITRYDMRNYND